MVCSNGDLWFLGIKTVGLKLRTSEQLVINFTLTSSSTAQVINTYPLHNFFRLFIVEKNFCKRVNEIKLIVIQYAHADAHRASAGGHPMSDNALNFHGLYEKQASHGSRDVVYQASI